MAAFYYVVSGIALLLLRFLQTMMFLRAILSWFPISEDSAILRFIYTVTEPIILPVRLLLSRFPAFQDLPIDLSFSITFLLLFLLQIFLR